MHKCGFISMGVYVPGWKPISSYVKISMPECGFIRCL